MTILKKHPYLCIALLCIPIAIALFINYAGYATYPFNGVSTMHADAKLLYAEAASYCVMLGSQGTEPIPDGIYCVATNERNVDTAAAERAIQGEFADHMQSILICSSKEYGAVYIKDGKPEFALSSNSEWMISHLSELTAMLLGAEKGSSIDIKGHICYGADSIFIGAYPYWLNGTGSVIQDPPTMDIPVYDTTGLYENDLIKLLYPLKGFVPLAVIYAALTAVGSVIHIIVRKIKGSRR